MTEKYPGFFTAVFGGRKAKEADPVKKTVKPEPSPQTELKESDSSEVETTKINDLKPAKYEPKEFVEE